MEKITVDLSDATNGHLNEQIYTQFATNVQNMLNSMLFAGFDVPVSIKGTQLQIDKFFRALKGEKKYMEAYLKHGLGDNRTMRSLC